ncbi:FCSD flavin-binding domain-containing protein [Dokdonella sp. MW10]|uniref:FCSD flavin-binding domain-containing protein n=1 Tax=Dokdonella sp. MW10 TaxID=2992926 RepID=UPI003F8155CD
MTLSRRRILGLLAGTALMPLARARDAAAKARVVVVGGGFAGASCARHLKAFAPTLDVVLVDPSTRHVSCPMSNAVIAGLRPMHSLRIGHDGLRAAGVRVVVDEVVGLDADARRARLRGGGSLPWDRLVFAGGMRVREDAIDGWDDEARRRMPHAWLAGEQTLRLARQLRAMRDGGRVAICVPPTPFRCPPGPYERASLIAHWLARHKPRSKLIVFDANNRFSKQALFTEAWTERYGDRITWVPSTQGGTLERVDARRMTLHLAGGAERVDVANVIPAQAAPTLAVTSGLAAAKGWCPVDAATFASEHLPGVHVIGDACIAGAMPKSASAANSQAKQCAFAILASLRGEPAPDGVLHNTCYSLVAPDHGISISGIYRVTDGQWHDVPGAGGMSPEHAPAAFRAREAGLAEGWYRSIVADAFGERVRG